MRGTDHRRARFAQLYAKLANGTKAAIEAGYSPKSASNTASQLIREPEIQELIESHRIKREVHADVTYANLINLADQALVLLQKTLNDPTAELRDQVMCFENARRCNETLATVEGLTVKLPPKSPDEGRISLQLLAQKLRQAMRGNLTDDKVNFPAPVGLPSPQPPTEGSAA